MIRGLKITLENKYNNGTKVPSNSHFNDFLVEAEVHPKDAWKVIKKLVNKELQISFRRVGQYSPYHQLWKNNHLSWFTSTPILRETLFFRARSTPSPYHNPAAVFSAPSSHVQLTIFWHQFAEGQEKPRTGNIGNRIPKIRPKNLIPYFLSVVSVEMRLRYSSCA